MSIPTTGLEKFLEDPVRLLRGQRVGLIANPTAVDRNLRHAVDLMAAHEDIDLRLLFGPEHGLRSDAQDMVSVEDERDSYTGLPVASLYGKSEESLMPTAEHVEQVDVLVFDIQDIGSRYYTYAATMALCMKAAARAGKRIIVLDRPNPIGGAQVEGSGLDTGLESFVGLFPVPQRHGMTVGELARLYNTHFDIHAELEVVTCDNWRREDYFDRTALPWVMPSPNMPTLDTAIVYPGMCLLEGTEVSEGRGTTRPFELFGAPWVDGHALLGELKRYDLPGVLFRPVGFTPTFHKFANQLCGGVQLHVTDRRVFLPYRTGLAVLYALHSLWPEHFEWRKKAYEFRDDVPAIDLLIGRECVREAIDQGDDFERVIELAKFGLEGFAEARAASLLY
jgi:uncharacterized protein YbbC (DUF1343 family)